MESCYEREVVLHGETTNQLIKSRETAKTFDEQVVELRSQRQEAEANLKDVAARLAELESASKTELELLRSELEVVNKQNSALHEQLANLSHQLTTLNKSGADLDVSLGGNESSEQVRIFFVLDEHKLISAFASTKPTWTKRDQKLVAMSLKTTL